MQRSNFKSFKFMNNSKNLSQKFRIMSKHRTIQTKKLDLSTNWTNHYLNMLNRNAKR